MVSTILNNLIAFGLSMPTNLVIILIVCLIMKLMGKTIVACIKVVVGYLVIGFLLGLVGIAMPSFTQIGAYVVNLVKSVW